MAKSDTNESRLGTAAIPGLIKELALPGIVAQIINLLYNIVDRIYIGRIPEVGSVALSGLGICMPIIMIVAAFASFAMQGGAPLAAINLGAGNQEKAERILKSGAGLTAVLSLIITAAGLYFKDRLLYFFGASDLNFSYASEYLGIYLIGSIFVLGTLALNAFISAQGQAKIAMRTVMIGAVSNIILDPIFIFAFNLGVKGAAIATVISQAISFFSVLAFMISPRTSLKLTGLALEGNLILDSVKLGISGFTMTATESAVTTVFNRLLGIYGGEMHIAAMVAMQSVMQMVFIPMSGYMTGVQPLLSYNYGAKKLERVKEILQRSLKMLISYTFIACMSAVIFPGFYANIFSNDSALIELIKQYLPIFIFGMSIFGLQNVTQMYFVGTNKPLNAMFLASLRKLILLIPLCFILTKIIGVKGVYLAEGIADFISASTAGVMLYLQMKKLFGKELI